MESIFFFNAFFNLKSLEIITAAPKKHFLITDMGCGIDGFTHAEIAPLFKDFLTIENCSLPQKFVELLESKKGYKVTDKNMSCRGFKYELNKVYTHEGAISICNSGFHYCEKLVDCFSYYEFNTSNRVFEVIDHGNSVIDGNKTCSSKIEFVHELSWLEVLDLCNMGKSNSGLSNAGNSNAGNRNAGNSNAGNSNAGNRNAGNDNAGYSNAGNSNAGNSNAGYSNAGNSNAGNRNAGYSNAGYRNAGCRNAGNSNAGNYNAGNSNAGYSNAGNSNAGNYNAGNRNAGYSNAGNDNAGAFNNLDNQPYIMFNKPSKWTYSDFVNSNAYKYLQQVDTALYVPSYKMTDQEKIDNPHHVTTQGYIRNIPYKEAFMNAWNNWTKEARQSFIDLPNFDREIFLDITSVDVELYK